MREIANLDLKIKLTNEYLKTGGTEKILSVNLLEDLIKIKFDESGNAKTETISSRVNAFMMGILHLNELPPVQIDNNLPEYISFIQKNLFFEQVKIDTKEQVDELFEKYSDVKDILFRGQKEAKWRLYSSLQRKWIWENMEDSGVDFHSFLERIVKNGRIAAKDNITNIFNDINEDTLNDIAILGYLQHHDCPTPLLDWTYNFETAMFFGVDGLEDNESPREIDHYFSIYFLEEVHFENGGMKAIINEGLQTIGEIIKLDFIKQIAKDEKQRAQMETQFKERSLFDKDRISGSGLISHMTKIERMLNFPLSYFSDRDLSLGIAFSLKNSENIRRQNGVFTWNSYQDKPLEDVGNEQFRENNSGDKSDDYRFCKCYNIHKNLSTYIKEKLEQKNISIEKMYPDKEINLQNIYEQSKEEYKSK